MERAVAVKKLAKMLGKKFRYQIDKDAPTKEERAAAREASKEALAERDRAAEAMTARREALLAADAEYQAHLALYKIKREQCQKLTEIMIRYKITVGTVNSLFFSVSAQGDSWEEVIAKLEKKKVPA